MVLLAGGKLFHISPLHEYSTFLRTLLGERTVASGMEKVILEMVLSKIR